jgi:hypothetical protein
MQAKTITVVIDENGNSTIDLAGFRDNSCAKVAEDFRGGDRVTLWGDGSPTREFLYVDDCVEGLVLAAERYGKHKTISQIVAIIALLVRESYVDWGRAGELIWGWHLFDQRPWIWWFAEASKWLAVILTFVSGWIYLWRNRALYLEDM